MDFKFNLSGNNIPLIKDFPINENESIAYGEAVGIKDGLVVKADEAEDILGVAVENHSGEKSELNARSNGNKIRVIISPDAVYGVKSKEYTATSGSENTLTVSSDGLSVGVDSGSAVLVRKGENSLNTDRIGTARKITGCTVSGDSATLTVEDGACISEGDVYVLIPEIGGEMKLDESGMGVCFFRQNTTCKFICTGYDDDGENVYVKLCDTIFA